MKEKINQHYINLKPLILFLQCRVIIMFIAKYFEDAKLYVGENELYFYVIKHPEKLMKKY